MLAGLGSYAGQVQPQAMAEGGVINAFSGKFFDSSRQAYTRTVKGNDSSRKWWGHKG